jgi:hypothetical protein
MSNPYIGEKTGQNHAAGSTMEAWHGYSPAHMGELDGKDVLVLGAGLQRWEDFAFYDYAPNANVTNVDPIYADWVEHRAYVQFPQYRIGKMICGVAQDIPIASSSVDAVFSTWSVPLIFLENIHNPDELSLQTKTVASEMYRVLRLGGFISLSPINTFDASIEEKQNQANFVLRQFREVGFDCKATEAYVQKDGKLHWSLGLRAFKK